jgi:hypothetical protein
MRRTFAVGQAAYALEKANAGLLSAAEDMAFNASMHALTPPLGLLRRVCPPPHLGLLHLDLPPPHLGPRTPT